MSYYTGKRALVTGGSEGIGLAVAQELHKRGAHVSIAGRSREKLEIAKCRLPFAAVHCLDLTDFLATQALIDEEAPFELVVNCVGFARPGYLLEQQVGEIRAMMETNLFAAVNLSKVLLPSWTARRSGHLVHTSSIAGFLGLFGYTGYCASKFALLGFCEALRREVRPYHIAVSLLCPPNTRTPGLLEENRTKPPEVLATEEKVAVVEPEWVARKLVEALPHRPFLVIPTFDGRMAHRLNRWAPSLLEPMLRRRGE